MKRTAGRHYDNYRYSADLDYSLLGTTTPEGLELVDDALGLDTLTLDTPKIHPAIWFSVAPRLNHADGSPMNLQYGKPSALGYHCRGPEANMSIHDEHHPVLPGDTLEEPRDVILASAQLFPSHEDMVIEGLTDDEEARFLAAIADA